jgi:hypothetical protein
MEFFFWICVIALSVFLLFLWRAFCDIESLNELIEKATGVDFLTLILGRRPVFFVIGEPLTRDEQHREYAQLRQKYTNQMRLFNCIIEGVTGRELDFLSQTYPDVHRLINYLIECEENPHKGCSNPNDFFRLADKHKQIHRMIQHYFIFKREKERTNH